MPSKKGQFFGRVDANGKIEIPNRAGMNALLKFLAGKAVTIAIAEAKRSRSDNQNRYYWGVVVKMLGDELGYAQDEMHDALKFKFLRLEAEPEKGRVLETVRSSSKLKTDEFEDYVERIRIWAASELGIVIPLPNEVI